MSASISNQHSSAALTQSQFPVRSYPVLTDPESRARIPILSKPIHLELSALERHRQIERLLGRPCSRARTPRASVRARAGGQCGEIADSPQRSRVRMATSRSYMPMAASLTASTTDVALAGNAQARAIQDRVHRIGEPAAVGRRAPGPRHGSPPVVIGHFSSRDRAFRELHELDVRSRGREMRRRSPPRSTRRAARCRRHSFDEPPAPRRSWQGNRASRRCAASEAAPRLRPAQVEAAARRRRPARSDRHPTPARARRATTAPAGKAPCR